MGKSKLTLYIFIALILGIFTGWAFPEAGIKLHALAEVFLRMVKMIIAPLLFSTLVVGIAGHGNIKQLGKIGLKTLIYFEIVTTLALVIGLWAGNYFEPGKGFNLSNVSVDNMRSLADMQSMHISTSFSETLVHMFPTSVIDAMAKGDILQVVVFSVFFAVAICSLGDKAKPILDVLNSLSNVMFKFTEYVMLFAPIGVFGAMAYTVSLNGLDILAVYAKLIGVLYLALFLFVSIVLIAVCKICSIPLIPLLKAIQEPALIAFSTATSEAALPKAMEQMEKFGVPKNIVGFVMPAGYTFNLDGSTLYLSLAFLFSAQVAGIHLTLSHQLVVMLTLMLTSKGIAGIPRVSLVVLIAALSSFNIPVIGVAILLGIDQILDMGRTTVNLIGNCVATTVIAKWENMFDYEKMNEFIDSKKVEKKTLVKEIVHSEPHYYEYQDDKDEFESVIK